MTNVNHQDLLLTAENQTVNRNELSVDARLQMRVEMDQATIEEYAEDIQSILSEHPIEVVEVANTEGVERFIVDGFHRYHAVLMTDLQEIPIKLMKGTFKQAQLYAMSTNGTHGLKANGADKKRAIEILLEHAPDFGYDSSKVIPWVRSFGFKQGVSTSHTAELRKRVDDVRDAEIGRLLDEGMSQNKVKETVGCSNEVVRKIATIRIEQGDKIVQSENVTPIVTPSPSLFDNSTSDENQSEAFNEEIRNDEVERQVAREELASGDRTGGNVYQFEDIRETPLEQVSGAINLFVEVFRRHGHQVIVDFVDDDSVVNEANLNALNQINAIIKSHLS